MPAARRLKPSQASALGHPEVHVPPCNPWDKDDRSKSEMNRFTAKHRRGQESEYVKNLAETLPFSEEVTSKLDRASVFRLIISYLQMREYTEESEEKYDAMKKRANRVEVFNHDKQLIPHNPKQNVEVDESSLMLDIMNGFVMFVSSKGKVVYVSENVSQHLGLNQVDMIGREVKDFIHPDDKGEIKKQLLVDFTDDRSKLFDYPMDEEETKEQCSRRFFYVRMRCVYLRKGIKNKQPGFMLVQWSGHLKSSTADEPEGLVCICRPLQPTPIVEIRMDGNMFMSRHSMDLKFTFCDQRIAPLLGYEPEEIIGQNAYLFHNPHDAHLCMDCHQELMHKGSSMSKYYRFLSKSGHWVWVQTRASIICNTHNEPQYVVCMNYIISEKEGMKSVGAAKKDEEKAKTPNGTSPYPDDTCSAPAFVEPFHSSLSSDSGEGSLTSSLTSSIGSPSTDLCISSPDSVFSSADEIDRSFPKRQRSDRYNSASINSMASSPGVSDSDYPMADSTTDDINQVRLLIQSLNNEPLLEPEPSTGFLNPNATDDLMEMLSEVMNTQTSNIYREFGQDHTITHPNEDVGPIFPPSPAPPFCSESSWSSAPAESVSSKNAAFAQRNQFGKLRSLFSQSGLNEISVAQSNVAPGKKMSTTRIEHVSPDKNMKNCAPYVESSNGFHSPFSTNTDSNISPEEQLDEIFSDVSLSDNNKGKGFNQYTSVNGIRHKADSTQGPPRKSAPRLKELLIRSSAPTSHTNTNFSTIVNQSLSKGSSSKKNDNALGSVSRSNGIARKPEVSVLEGLLLGRVDPNDAHRVAINEDAPSYMSIPTSPETDTSLDALDSEPDDTMGQHMNDPTMASVALSLDDADLCLNIPEYSDWRELLGPLSPRSQALVEEAESILYEVDRQESQTCNYWEVNS